MTRTHEDLGRYGADLADSSARSLASLSDGAQAIAAEATEYTRKSIEAGASFMEALFSAASIEDAADVQAAYVRQSYAAFVAETSRVSELYAELARDAYRPFESLTVAAN